MQHKDETCRPDSLWRRLLSDWLSEGDRAPALRAQAADERPEDKEAREDLVA
ncbi:MAG: hypothetical protein R3285_02710 [Kiloniellales bacterium]|nr:hypothetical protein [Kiloniellales bacterium]